MLALEAQVDDELGEASVPPADEVTISLIYPHWRTGTLPISARVKRLFPTAYKWARVRFTLVDAKTGRKIPAWVVRKHGYVHGLADWYKTHDLIPGALIRIRNGEQPGEVASRHLPIVRFVIGCGRSLWVRMEVGVRLVKTANLCGIK